MLQSLRRSARAFIEILLGRLNGDSPRDFQKLDMLERWRGTLSDDFALTRALRAAKLPIRFVPNCLTASMDNCSFAELLEFTTRQMKITRVYSAHLWKISLVTNLFSCSCSSAALRSSSRALLSDFHTRCRSCSC
jgi:hypothetical protein